MSDVRLAAKQGTTETLTLFLYFRGDDKKVDRPTWADLVVETLKKNNDGWISGPKIWDILLSLNFAKLQSK